MPKGDREENLAWRGVYTVMVIKDIFQRSSEVKMSFVYNWLLHASRKNEMFWTTVIYLMLLAMVAGNINRTLLSLPMFHQFLLCLGVAQSVSSVCREN